LAIDDLKVKIGTAQEQEWNVLFNEDFERFDNEEQLKDSGWVSLTTLNQTAESVAMKIKILATDKHGQHGQLSFPLFFHSSFIIQHSAFKSLSFYLGALVAKNFQVPRSFSFDVSDKPFEIKYNDHMDNSLSPGSTENNSRQFYNYTDDSGDKVHGPYLSPATTDKIQAITTNYIDTYYIYSFDGKLLSEYDQTGNCVRDYIYAGNRLIAEYRPATGKYYYYMSDQINSTRIITDDSGTVVYSEAYGPYGDVQKTWTKTYDPKQKFSSKEREGYSELDYFGARYFDNNSYRFISPDPISTKDKAIANPQYWNLYAYCGNKPITSFDPSGLDNYVFYDSRNFSKQASVEKTRLEGLNGETTHMKEISTRQEFETEWSGMNNPTEVTLLFHSGGGAGRGNTIAINYKEKEYLVTDPSGKTPGGIKSTYVGNLAKKSIKELNLYICYSAMGANNLAKTFFKTQDVQKVNGASGPFNYNRWYFLEFPFWAPRESNQMVSSQLN
jgi:RHS repeat-associated protein